MTFNILKSLKKLLEPGNFFCCIYLFIYLGMGIFVITEISDIMRYPLIKKSDLQEITIEHVETLWSTKVAESGRFAGGSIRIYQKDNEEDEWRYDAVCSGAGKFCGIRQRTDFQDATVVLLWAPNRFDIPPEEPNGPIKRVFIQEIREQGKVVFKNDEYGLDSFISFSRENTIFGWVIYIFIWIILLLGLFILLRIMFTDPKPNE